MTTTNMMQIRAAAAGLIRDTLYIHDDTFRVEERFRKLSLLGTGDADRRLLMGSPTRYCEVVHVGDAGGNLPIGGGARSGARYRFLVSIWYGYEDAEDYAQSSQASWDEILETEEEGLLVVLREKGTLVIAGDVINLSAPASVQVDLRGTETQFDHFCSFELIASNQL